ncbi:hypothetical protein SUGI_0858360 [Cryptomeria japonica]|uniref:uncharacterized protein LOC131043259 n=1 Tax=Cryptomeria japonica TaxID=3369 RepID=UPI0024147AE6|nr:uncharacterized protein LOC131043259 [Cryptomeria japonica]GLJ41475.1 hypothetical protein SUGI_0858360 [Cryptomeria japonica]
MAEKGKQIGAMDPMVPSEYSAHKVSESAAAKWLNSIRSTDSLPPQNETHGFQESLIIRQLTVNQVEPGIVIATITVHSSLTNRYNTLHGGAVAMISNIVGMAAVKTVAVDKDFEPAELSMSYVYAGRIGVELEVKAKVLKFENNAAVSSIDIRNKETKQAIFQGCCTFHSMPKSRM